jgi:hypothetical protein
MFMRLSKRTETETRTEEATMTMTARQAEQLFTYATDRLRELRRTGLDAELAEQVSRAIDALAAGGETTVADGLRCELGLVLFMRT